MRQVIDNFLYNNKDAILLVADFGKFPLMETTDRYINVQLSESLMINIAIGLSNAGKKVYVYSAAGFSIYRAFDTIRHNIVETHVCNNITFLNAGSGFIYNFGLTHMLIDDLNIMNSSFCNFNVYMPYDEQSTIAALNSNGIIYIRLCPDNVQKFNIIKKQNPLLYVYCSGFILNKVQTLVEENFVNVQVLPFYSLNTKLKKNSILIVDSMKINNINIPQLCYKTNIANFYGTYDQRLNEFGFNDNAIITFIKKYYEQTAN